MISLSTPLSSIQGISSHFLVRLARLKIETVGDLLRHFPTRYEDFSQIYKIADLEPGQQATIQAAVEDIEVRRSFRKRMTIIEAMVADDTGTLKAVWFNQPYVQNSLRPGRIANFSGKVTIADGELALTHPTYELLNNSETRHTARLVPIYPETKGMTSKGFRFFIQPLLNQLERLEDWIPPEVLSHQRLPDLVSALKQIHFPSSIETAMRAKERFSFENLFLLQLFNLSQKAQLAREKSPQIPSDVEFLKNLVKKLPFELTLSQKKSLWEVVQDMEKPHPMNRLLQGDVGSGKTVVAALAALSAANRGYQTAIMAPTEVLAKQHYETFKKLFRGVVAGAQPVLGLITGSSSQVFYENDLESSVPKKAFSEKTLSLEIKIAIGTHALIFGEKKGAKQNALRFNNLGLVVVDEQHRFGVEQRAALLGQGGLVPHFLSMSATPIPRTLMLTVFGDLDLSLISEMPAGRVGIKTSIVPPGERDAAYNFIRKEINAGRQAFVICPRITATEEAAQSFPAGAMEKLEVKSVEEEYGKLSKKIFPELKVAMLHGQLKPKEKSEVMKEFREGKTQILVSTSVIEVGVDVPNATIMVIEGAERFGLAQLYQFRGRVGRGEHQSYCLLFADSKSQTARERLKALLEAKNGFELAERDLKIRGPGEFIGQNQSGLPDYAMQALQNAELVKSAREAAQLILATNNWQKKYPALKTRFRGFESAIHLE